MEEKKYTFRHYFVTWLIFSIVFLIVASITIFYFDLANGPLYVFILAMINLACLLAARFVFFRKRFWVRNNSWAVFLLVTVVLVILAHPSVERKRAVNTNFIQTTEVLSLKNGPVQGMYTDDREVEVYAGIPYAKPPIGAYRWRPTEPVEDWSEVKDCTYFAPRSMQEDSSPIVDSLVDMYAEKGWHPDYNMKPLEPKSEDSLYLNIWRPAGISKDAKLPILVYIHGGSLTTGSSSFEDYNGETFARNGVIMITIAYRLGVFGYFAHPELMNESGTTGNYGLLDQIEALKWINANAEYFGGDKNNITIAGESAGSSSVSALCVSPLASGLFKRAIGESSSLIVKRPPHTFRKLEEAYEVGNSVLQEFKVNSVEELRGIDANKLVKTKSTNSGMTIDNHAIIEYPYETYSKNMNNEEALLNGYNVKEADAFVVPQYLFSPTNKGNIRERLLTNFDEVTTDKIMNLYATKIEEDAFSSLNEIMSVYWFIYPHHVWSDMAFNSLNNTSIYRYQFTKENGYRGTYHSGELIYAYGNLDKSTHQFAYNNEDRALSNLMVSYWTNFIKSGDPNGNNLPTWNKYNPDSHNVMELGANVKEFTDQYLELYKILDEYMNTKASE